MDTRAMWRYLPILEKGASGTQNAMRCRFVLALRFHCANFQLSLAFNGLCACELLLLQLYHQAITSLGASQLLSWI